MRRRNTVLAALGALTLVGGALYIALDPGPGTDGASSDSSRRYDSGSDGEISRETGRVEPEREKTPETKSLPEGNCRVVAGEPETSRDAGVGWSESDAPRTVRMGTEHGASEVRTFQSSEFGTFAAGRQGPTAWSNGLPPSPLWQVDCENPSNASVVGPSEEVSFSHGIFDRDRQVVYGGARGGIVRIALEDGSVARVTSPEKRRGSVATGSERCWTDPGVPADLPIALLDDGNRIVAKRGDTCGYENSWEFKAIAIEFSENGETDPAVRSLHHPTDLAEAPDGSTWLADGATCSLAWNGGAGLHFAGAGVLRRGPDDDSWSKVATALPEASGTDEGTTVEPPNGFAVKWPNEQTLEPLRARLVEPHPDDADRMVVATHVCRVDGVGSVGGRLMFSRDGGSSWWEIRRPQSEEVSGRGDSMRVWALEAVGDSLRHLRIWGSPPSCTPFQFGSSRQPPLGAADCEETEETSHPAWETKDGGETWTELDSTHPPPPTRRLELPEGGQLKIDRGEGRVFERSAETEQRRISYPEPN